MSEEYVNLWTRQDIRSLREIEEKGRYRVKKSYIEEQFDDISNHYLNAYKWLVEASSKIVAKPNGVEYPVWCSISDKNMLRTITGTVVYKLLVNKDDIVYFDGSKWDYVLNHMYIPKNSEDEKRYKLEMKEKGFNDSFSFISGKYAHFYPLEKKRVIDSWERIFEIDDWNIFQVQANIWEIRSDMIVEMEVLEK